MNAIIKTTIGLAIVVLVIAAIAIPIISGIQPTTATYSNGETPYHYREIDPNETIKITIDYNSNGNIKLDGYEISLEPGETMPIFISDGGNASISNRIGSSGDYSLCGISTQYTSTSGTLGNWYVRAGSDYTITIEISNNVVTIKEDSSLIKTTYPFTTLYLLDENGDLGAYGLYTLNNDFSQKIYAPSDFLIIDIMDTSDRKQVGSFTYPRLALMEDGNLTYYQFGGAGAPTSNDASIDTTRLDGDVIEYIFPMTIPEGSNSQTETSYIMGIIAPIEFSVGDDSPAIWSLIDTIPIIMMAGVVVATVAAFLTYRLKED